MAREQEMLRECSRVMRAGGFMELSVISLARQSTSEDERRMLQRSGPPYPDAGADYAELLEEAHWTLLERINVTSEFTRCMEVLLDESRERQSALVELLGEKDYAERVERRRSRIRAACYRYRG